MQQSPVETAKIVLSFEIIFDVFYTVCVFFKQRNCYDAKTYFGRFAVGVLPTVLHPYSRGTIKLASADPLQRPLIDPQILADERDKQAMKAGK